MDIEKMRKAVAKHDREAREIAIERMFDDVKVAVRDGCKKQGFSLSYCAANAGVSLAVLSNFLNGQRSMSLAVVARLLLVLGLRLHVIVTPIESE